MKKVISLLLILVFFTSCDNKHVVLEDPSEDDKEQTEEEKPEPKPVEPTIRHFYPDIKGRLNVSAEESAKILPGDTVYLRGRFLNVKFTGLKGTKGKPIRITNYPGEVLVLGEPNWIGGAYCNAIQLQECKQIILGSETSSSSFKITGSVNPDATGGYIGISLQPFTDNVEVKNISISGGTVGILSKTDPQKDDPRTWHPNTLLENLSIHDVTINNVKGVVMYIGHTSIHWGWDENGRGYSAGVVPSNPSHQVVEPVRWNNVKVYNNQVSGSGLDGIQISSANNLEIYENEVSYFGLYELFGQSIGILVGGNSTNTYVHDNYVHNGFGEGFQMHGSGRDNSTHVVTNNLFDNIKATGLGIYGLTDDATIEVTNNTVARCLSSAITVNGRGKNPLVKLTNNLFIACNLQQPSFDKYIKTLNGGIIERTGNNLMYYSADDAKVNASNYYTPFPDSEVKTEGYRKWR